MHNLWNKRIKGRNLKEKNTYSKNIVRYKKVFSLLFFCFSSSSCYRVPLLVNIAIARPHELGGLSHLQGAHVTSVGGESAVATSV